MKTAMPFYELRQYKILPGKMNEWLKLMEETIIPFQVSKGMVITSSFRGEDDDSVYVWTRREDVRISVERERLSHLSSGGLGLLDVTTQAVGRLEGLDQHR